MPKVVPLAQSLQDLRNCMRKWDIDMYEAIPLSDNRRGLGGMAVRYYRAGTWQEVRCETAVDKATNLRRCLLLLDRLRVAEDQGVVYSGLTSTKELVKAASPESDQKEEELDSYGILGVAPDDPIELIKDVYRRKSVYYHPDKPTGDTEKFKRLAGAYELIMKSRGTR